jgi:hypothetical protein
MKLHILPIFSFVHNPGGWSLYLGWLWWDWEVRL